MPDGADIVKDVAKKAKNVALLGSVGCLPIGIIGGVVLFLIIIGGVMSPIEANTSYTTSSGVTSKYGEKKTDDWAQYNEEEQKEKETYYKKVTELAKDYKDDGITIDTALVTSILFYGQSISPEESFACNREDITDEEGNVVDSECKGDEKKNKISATELYNDSKKLIKGMIDSEGNLKSDEDYRQWLKDNYLEDKLEDLDIDIPGDPKLKDRKYEDALDEIFQMRDIYVDITYGSEQGGTCDPISSADPNSKKKVRLTSYQYNTPEGQDRSLGGSIGDVEPYIKEGTVSFDENGYAMWKGGTKSKLDGKVYGEAGKDYLIVATATKYLIGQYSFVENDKIQYFEYNDTFTLEISPKGRPTKVYNAIVLDSCGACMDWSTTSNGQYKPTGSNIKLCEDTNNMKIDIFTNQGGSKGLVAPGDVGYFMNGTNGTTCIGSIDLGELVTGWNDTKGLNGKTLLEVLGNQGIEELNQQIKANAEKYGKGTGTGAAAAAITLINGLKNKGYRLNYYWGGGHGGGDATIIGVNPSWGKNMGPSYMGILHPYLSMDCSGFVNWAIRNGGCDGHVGGTTRTMETYGKNISDPTKLKPGDILVNDEHVSMVVQNNGGKVIVAESNPMGILYTEYEEFIKYSSPYTLKDMSGWYASNCK